MMEVAAELLNLPDWHGVTGYTVPDGAFRISNSEIAAFMRCPRKWYVHYYLGWQPDPMEMKPVSNALLGTRGHLCLQAFYGHGMNPLLVAHAIYAYEMERRPEFADELRAEYDMLVSILEGYAEWLEEEGSDRGLTPVGAEQEMSYPLGTIHGIEAWLSAHLDVVVFDAHANRYMFMDHKFVGAFEAANELQRNPQMKTYVLLQRLNAGVNKGTPVNGGLFNMLKRSKRTAKATPPFYKREPVTYNQQQIDAHWRKVHAVVSAVILKRQELDAAGARDIADIPARDEIQQYLVPPSPLPSCSWDCPIPRQCVMMDDGSRWGAALSAAFIQGDPYAYYGRGLLAELQEAGKL